MIGDYRNLVSVANPGEPVADGDGGYTLTWAPLDPPVWWTSIAPATVQDQERIGAGTGTIIDKATSIITGRHHLGISTATRVVLNTTTYALAGVRHVPHQDLTETIAVEVETP